MGKKKKGQESDYQEIELLKRQLHKARSKGDFKEVGALLNQLGVAYRDRKDYEEALEEHEEEIRITRKHFPSDKIALAIAYRGKAEVYIEMNDQASALPLVKDYLKMSIEADDLVEQQRAHITLGRVYLGLAVRYMEEELDSSLKDKGLEKAEKEFRKARDLLNHRRVQSQQPESSLMDMKCGVFINIAIVLEMKGQLEESKQFFLKAIEIGKKHSLLEHMHRSFVCLCDLYAKLGDHREARRSAEEAGKVSRALGNKTMEVEAKFLEAKSYFMLDEIGAGVKLLKKSRKILSQCESNDNVELLNDINSVLRSGIRIKRTEDTLDFTDSKNYTKRKQLFECAADNYVKIGNYTSAILYYQKAIECVEMGQMASSELAKLYYSLAETYKDKNDHFKALQYYEKEIILHKNNPAEAFKTQTNIIASMENSKMNVDEIIDACEKAIQLSIMCGCPRKQVVALKNKANYFTSIQLLDEAREIMKKCKEIQELYNLTGDIEEDSQELQTESDDSIDLENLSSDDETDEEHHKIETTTKQRKIRLNEKGETPLHIASQKGDFKTVKRLLREGHNVNARDCAGWTPLHEACNFGAAEVVEALLENGANVNDPGGEFCDMTTPMHDAAANGHIEVMKVMLKYNPNVLAKNSQGNFVLDELINWKTRTAVDDEPIIQKYNEMKMSLKSLMQKVGYQYKKLDEVRARRKRKERSSSPKSALLRGRRGLIPVKTVIDDFDPDSADAAIDLYSSTMQGLRRNPGKQKRKPTKNNLDEESNSSQSDSPVEALIPESQHVGDDWLDDDMDNGKNKVKRKRDPMDDIRLIDRNTKRKRNGQRNDIATIDIVDNDNSSDTSQHFPILQMKEKTTSTIECRGNELDLDSSSRDSTRSHTSTSSPRRVFEDSFDEPTVIENIEGFSGSDDDVSGVRSRNGLSSEILINSDSDGNGSPTVFRPRSGRSRRARIIQTKLPFRVVDTCNKSNEIHNDSGRDQTHHSSSTIRLLKPLRIKVHVGEKLLLVPVAQEYLMNTIDWLCEECAKRYSESSGLKATLTLSTIDGALLSGSDIIHSVLNGPEVDLNAKVVSVDLPRLPARFQSLISRFPNFKFEDGILLALEICQSSNSLNLSEYSLHSQVGQLIFQALKYQYDLKELILSECVLQDVGVKQLGAILPTLPSLAILDLSCNGITSDGLRVFTESLKLKSDIPVDKVSSGLTSLNLSFNPLGNSAGPYLTDLLLQLPQLKTLLLTDCDFTVRLLAESRVIDAFKKLKLEELEISYNSWGPTGMELILQSMPPDRAKVLNLKSVSCLSNMSEDVY